MTTNYHVKTGVAREVEMAKKPEEKLYFSIWHSIPVESKRTFNSSNVFVLLRYDVSTN